MNRWFSKKFDVLMNFVLCYTKNFVNFENLPVYFFIGSLYKNSIYLCSDNLKMSKKRREEKTFTTYRQCLLKYSCENPVFYAIFCFYIFVVIISFIFVINFIKKVVI